VPDRTVTVKVVAQVQQAIAAMAALGSTVKGVGTEIDKATTTEKGRTQLGKLTTATGLLGGALVGVGIAAVKMSSDFEAAMSKVKSNINDKSAKSMKALSDAALDMGKNTQFSATQAADAEDELAKAGVTAQSVLSGGLKGALDLAAAGQLNVGDAAEIAASAMNDFNLTGAQIPHIADLLAAGADKAQGSVQDLGAALKYVGPVAGDMGVSIESTVGVLTEFASRGIMGEQAGTSLRGVLSSLTSPSQQATAQMRSLGIQLYDSSGKFMGLSNLAGQLHDKMSGLTDAQRDAAFGIMFGNTQVTAARILYAGGAKAVNDFTKEVNEAGFASQSASTKMDNLQGDLKKLTSSLQTDLIAAGTGANSALRKLTQTGTALVNNFGALPKSFQEGAVYVSTFAGAAMLAFTGVTKLKGKISEIKDALTGLGPAGTKAASGLGALASIGGKLALLATVGATVNAVAAATRAAPVPVGKLAASLLDYAETGRVAGNATAILGKNLKTFSSDIQNFGTGNYGKFTEGFASIVDSLIGADAYMDDSVNNARQRMDQLDQALVQLVSSGHADQAKQVFANLLKATKDQGGNVNDLKNALPQYSAALGSLAQASANATTATRQAADAGKTLAGSWEAAVNQGKSLADVFNMLNGTATGTDAAEIKVTNSFADLTTALQNNGNQLDINNAKGAANRQAMIDNATSIRDAVQARYQETGSLTAANALYTQYINQLRATLTQAGLTKAQIDDLIARYYAMPASVETKTTAPGATQSASEIDQLHAKEAELERKIDVLVKTNAPTNELQRYQQQLDALHDREITIFTRTQTDNSGTEHVSTFNAGGRREAEGGIIDYYANGGIREPTHLAQIVPGGTYRVLAEDETGGEGYIPLAPSKRSRSLDVWEAVGRRLGVRLGAMSSGPTAMPYHAVTAAAAHPAGAVGASMAAHLAPQLHAVAAQICAAIAAGRMTSLNVNGREFMRLVDEQHRQSTYVG
jgi:TP901 family phage tail tape measure protein